MYVQSPWVQYTVCICSFTYRIYHSVLCVHTYICTTLYYVNVYLYSPVLCVHISVQPCTMGTFTCTTLYYVYVYLYSAVLCVHIPVQPCTTYVNIYLYNPVLCVHISVQPCTVCISVLPCTVYNIEWDPYNPAS